ncbi:PH domain-containing protein [Streptomyces luteireticuli]|uniref:Low molecular weight protein antigen 6 PH domain-containing protein n=1 Tax=Streptomyces luteireticuli TaxID=173858 RepID=A0ABN0Z6D3_9ACTN
MHILEIRPISRLWQWCAAVGFLITGIVPACVVTFGMGWAEYGRRYAAESRAGTLTQATIGLSLCAFLSLVACYYTSGLTYVTDEGIRTRTLLWRRNVRWKDVKSIDIDLFDETIGGRRSGPVYRIRVDLVNGKSFYLPGLAKGECDTALEQAKGQVVRRWKAQLGTAGANSTCRPGS